MLRINIRSKVDDDDFGSRTVSTVGAGCGDPGFDSQYQLGK